MENIEQRIETVLGKINDYEKNLKNSSEHSERLFCQNQITALCNELVELRREKNIKLREGKLLFARKERS